MARPLVILLAGLVASALAPVALSAQDAQFGVSGGLAVPTGDYGDTRVPGPLIRGSLTLGGPQRHLRLRLDVEGAWLIDRDGKSSGSNQQGTLRAVSSLASLVVGGTSPRVAPYLIVGLGVQRLTVESSQNPYGVTVGARAGAGLRWRVGRVTMHAEVTPHLALTDFGTGRDYTGGTYVPVVLGVSF